MCVYEKYSTKTLIVRLFMIKTTRRTRLSINRTSRLASLTCRAFNPINLTFLKLFIKVSRLMLYSRITIKQFRFPIHKPHIYMYVKPYEHVAGIEIKTNVFRIFFTPADRTRRNNLMTHASWKTFTTTAFFNSFFFFHTKFYTIYLPNGLVRPNELIIKHIKVQYSLCETV